MRELPFDLRFDVGPSLVHLVHGSSPQVNEYLFGHKPASLYERLVAAEQADTRGPGGPGFSSNRPSLPGCRSDTGWSATSSSSRS